MKENKKKILKKDKKKSGIIRLDELKNCNIFFNL